MNTKIILTRKLYNRMLAYARVTDGEVSGWGRTQTTRVTPEETIVHVHNIKIFKQVVTGAHTTLDNVALTGFYVDLVRAGEDPKLWNLWWHSHNTFSVFFSGVDTNTIEERSKNSTLYSICINKAGDLVGRHDYKGQLVSEADIVIAVPPIAPEVMEACRKEVKEKVSHEGYQPIDPYGFIRKRFDVPAPQNTEEEYEDESYIYAPRRNSFL